MRPADAASQQFRLGMPARGRTSTGAEEDAGGLSAAIKGAIGCVSALRISFRS
jgi:hypothetical protein